MSRPSETPVADVLIWLGRVTPAIAEQTLIGCMLDDGSSDDAVLVSGLDLPRRLVSLSDGRRVLLRSVLDGVVIDARPGAPLAEAVAGCWTTSELEERRDRLRLGRAGIAAAKLSSKADRDAVLVFLAVLAAGGLPDGSQRHGFYMALRAGKDPGLARIGARLIGEVMEAFRQGGMVPEDLHWRRAWFLRTAGHLVEAVAASDILHAGRLRDANARKILATMRAGALLDLFDVRGGHALLADAERSLKMAYALGPGDGEVNELYRRYNRAWQGIGSR